MRYPPPYEREIWYYQHVNVDQIQRAIEQLSCEKSFRNLNINEIVFLFNKTIKNILSSYTPHEKITYGDKDPPWFNKNIKQLIQEKNNTYKSYILDDKNPQIFGAIALSCPPSVRVRATVKLSATFFHDESSITKGGERKCNNAKFSRR